MQDIINYIDRGWEIEYNELQMNDGYPTFHWEQSLLRSSTWYISGYEEHNITLNVSGEGNIIKDTEILKAPHTQEYERGSKITLTAQPEEGYEFAEWESDKEGILGNSKEITFTVRQEDEISAYFVPKTNVSLSLNQGIFSSEETVEVTITNEGEGDLYLSNTQPFRPHAIHRKENEEWEQIEFYNPSDPVLPGVPEPIEPGENHTYNWSQGEYFYRDGKYVETQAKPGQYKVEWFNETIEFELKSSEDGYVNVTTNKEEYEQGEEVEIQIENMYDKTIRISNSSPAIPDVIRVNDEELTFYDPDSNFMHIPVELEQGEIATFIWNQKKYSSPEEQVEPGNYSVTWYNEETQFEILEEDPEEPTENYTLTIDIEGEGSVEIDPDQDEYEEGEEVTLTAEAEEDWTFIEWTGDHESEEEEIIVTMDQDKTVTAVFEEADPEPTPVTPTAATALTIISITIIFAAAVILYVKNKEGY